MSWHSNMCIHSRHKRSHNNTTLISFLPRTICKLFSPQTDFWLQAKYYKRRILSLWLMEKVKESRTHSFFTQTFSQRKKEFWKEQIPYVHTHIIAVTWLWEKGERDNKIQFANLKSFHFHLTKRHTLIPWDRHAEKISYCNNNTAPIPIHTTALYFILCV